MSIRIAGVGLSHPHIYNQVNALLSGGAELVSFWGDEPENIETFKERFPQAKQANTIDEILEDESIQLVTSAAIPCDRAPLGVRVMQHGKDYLADKPAFTSLEQLAEARRVQAETGRKFIVHFGERFDNRATVKALDLVQAGAIGQVVQTVGFGPHRFLGHIPRPYWAKDMKYVGGTINDLASHQVDQFLIFTGSTSAEVVMSQVGNAHHQQFENFEDFGDLTLRSPQGTGYIRVDWLTPKGLNSWGDGRLFVLGTDGYIELRKNIDIAGPEGASHLYIVDHESARYIDCADVPLVFGTQLVQDVINRTETAVTQAHAFLASELALIAQKQAVHLPFEQPHP